MPFFKVDGNLDLHYKVLGEGEIKVLFITGISAVTELVSFVML